MPEHTEDIKTEKKEMNIRNKAVGAVILMVALFIPVSMILYFLGRSDCWRREIQLEEMNQEVLLRISGYGNRQYLAAESEFDDYVRKEIDLTVSFLQLYVTENGYNGPEILDNGFVVRPDQDLTDLPVHLSEDSPSVDKSLIEESLKNGKMRTAFAREGSLSFGRISDDAVYVQVTPEEEHRQMLDLYIENIKSAMETATEMAGRMTMLVRKENGQLFTLEQFGDPLLKGGVQKLGLTAENVDSNREGTRKIDGKRYRYICAETEGDWLECGNLYIVQVFLLDRIISQMLLLIVMTCLLMLVFYVTIITYSISEVAFIRNRILDEEEEERYNPKRLRRRLLCAGAVSAVLIFAIAYLTQSVIQMRQQTANGKHTLQLLAGQRDRILDRLDENVQEVRENRYVHYGTIITSFLENCPEERKEEKIKKCSEIIGADFIMLFNHDGHEILCSKDYENFSIDRGMGENSSDFRRLLLGIEGIVHPVSTDTMTGLERQMIGVTVNPSGDDEGHGALVLALMPDATAMSEETVEEEALSMLLPDETICFGADKRTGEILYSSELSMEGKTVMEVGLKESSLQGGYMDFGKVSGVQRFVVASEEGERGNIYFYAEDNSMLRRENLQYGLESAGVYICGLIILMLYLLRGYNEESYRRWSAFDFKFGTDDEETENEDRKSALLKKIGSVKNRLNQADGEDDRMVKNRLIRISGWDTMLPEKRASTVFMIGLFIVLQMWVILMMGNYLMHGTEQTLLDYLLNGDWMHGFNMFALYSILLCIASANLVIMGSGWFLQLFAGFLGAKGETVCRLLRSLIKLIAIIIVIGMALNYVGLLNSQVLASMGIGSLALSLGAKDIIADVLSGILIVFNETVRVGDIVEYQGITATVLDVRIQNTQLSTFPDNDIMTVRNQAITSIINKSRTASVYNLKLQVRADAPLEQIEALMDEALPKIREGCPGIIGTPQYLGVVGLGYMEMSGIPVLTLQVNAQCDVKDKFIVMTYMNKELHLLFARAGIEVF